mmetsp:Transcript_12562/g.38397  ORF Transcript_12562/g.38397 Transcript_12562/m.38397 type:complete len:467 (+) Transcript_12562:241-1641(+)
MVTRGELRRLLIAARGDLDKLVRPAFVHRDKGDALAVGKWIAAVRVQFTAAYALHVYEHALKAGLNVEKREAEMMLRAATSGYGVSDEVLVHAARMLKATNINVGNDIFTTIGTRLATGGHIQEIRDLNAFAKAKKGQRVSQLEVAEAIALLRTGSTRKGLRLIKQLKDSAAVVRLGKEAYYALVLAAARQGDMKTLLDAIAAFIKEGYDPDIKIYSAIISVHARSGNYEGVMQTIQEMKSAGFAVETFHWNMLMDAHVRRGNLEEANAVLDKMDQPDALSFKILSRGRRKAGDRMGGRIALERARKAVSGPLLVEVYNEEIDAAIEEGKLDDAEKAFAVLTRSGVRANGATFLLRSRHCAIRGDVDQACQAIKMARKRGLLVPRDDLVVGLLNDFLSRKCPRGALQVLRTCLEVDIEVKPSFYGSVIGKLDRDDALNAFSLYKQTNRPIDKSTKQSNTSKCGCAH